MKVLFLNQFFWPDSSATSQQLTDMAAGLAARPGMEVSVLCGDGGYADSASSAAPDNVRILRVKTTPFVKGKIGRVTAYGSYYLGALARMLFAPKQDVIISLTTPPLISLLGTVVKTLRGSRHIIWEQDVYPDVARDLGAFRAGGVVDRVVGTLADVSRRDADSIVALGECMKSRLEHRGIPAGQIQIVENWADSGKVQPMPRPGDPGELVLLYSGNLGLAHDLGTLEGALTRLGNDPRFRFLFVGGGARRKDLADFCQQHGIGSVEFRPYVDRDKLWEGLTAGDIGLVTQHTVCCGSVVPSKVYGILAAGRPILFIGPRAATPAAVIERHGCGWVIEPGDSDGLHKLLLHLAAHRDEVAAAGERAREALVEHYDLPVSIERFAGVLEGMISRPANSSANAFSQLSTPTETR